MYPWSIKLSLNIFSIRSFAGNERDFDESTIPFFDLSPNEEMMLQCKNLGLRKLFAVAGAHKFRFHSNKSFESDNIRMKI